MTLIYPCIDEIFNQYLSRKVSSYLNGICPKRRMSCIGNYRRNLIFFEETSRYVSWWALFFILQGTVIIIAMTLDSHTLTSNMVFWIHNILAFAFIDIFHGIIIPLKMTIPPSTIPTPRQQTSRSTPLSLEPRRYMEGLRPPLVSRPAPNPSPAVERMPRSWQLTGLTVWQVSF